VVGVADAEIRRRDDRGDARTGAEGEVLRMDVPSTRLEQLCRYLLQPAVAQDRLRLRDDRRVMLTLKSAWACGTRQLLFEPLELLA